YVWENLPLQVFLDVLVERYVLVVPEFGVRFGLALDGLDFAFGVADADGVAQSLGERGAGRPGEFSVGDDLADLLDSFGLLPPGRAEQRAQRLDELLGRMEFLDRLGREQRGEGVLANLESQPQRALDSDAA